MGEAPAQPGILHPHGVWVTLTAVVILKPNFGGTYQQAVQRVGGMIAGSVIGAILAAAITTLPGIKTFTTELDRALRDLADTVRSGRRPAPLPALDASRSAAHDAIRGLMTAGATKPGQNRRSSSTAMPAALSLR